MRDERIRPTIAERDRVRAERDTWHRLFSRLDAAISHHKAGCEANDVPDTHDEALWVARSRILKDAVDQLSALASSDTKENA